MIIGATTFSYVVGNMASLISKLDGLSGAFREKMDQATVFMHENHIPKDLKLRIRKYYDYSFNHPMVNLQGSMLQDLSPALYNEVVRFIRRDVLASVSLFSSLNNKQRRHLLSALQPKLIPTQHGPSDYIFYSGELGKSFYIVVTGEVDLIDPETREVFATFRQGNYFGENALLPDEERRPFTVRARSWCDILAMRVKDLEVVLHDFPSILSSIRLTARLRWARLLKAYEAHRVLVLARQRKIHVNGKTLLRVMSRIDDQGAYTPFEPSSVLQLMEDIGPDKKKQNKSIGKDSEDRLKDIDSLSIEEQQSLLVDLKDTVLHSEVGKQLAAGIRLSGRSGWDWSRDWVDGDDISSESTRLSAHYNGAALADKAVKKTVGDRGWKSFTQVDDDEDHQPMSNLNLDSDHVAPGVALGRALERIISRLDVIEAQTDMHEVLVQLKRLNQLSAERNEAEKEKSLNVPINLMTSVRGFDQGGSRAANSDLGSQSQADFQSQEM
jgi:CRP-like cAMP-binding protein